MLKIPLDWQTKLSLSIDNLVVATQSVTRNSSQPNDAFHKAFEILVPTLEAQDALETSFQPNFVGMIALEMFRNSWYHAPRPALIEATFWYNKTTCVFGIVDGGPYFKTHSVKQQWETAHATRDLKAIKTSVTNPQDVRAFNYGGGHNAGTGMALHAPYLRVDTEQGALFLGFRNDELNN